MILFMKRESARERERERKSARESESESESERSDQFKKSLILNYL
jgi:hypothetical protein